MSDDNDDLVAAFAALVAAARTPAPAAAAPQKLLTVEEAADQLRVSRSMIYSALRDGTLRGIKIGRRRLIPVTEVTRLISEAA